MSDSLPAIPEVVTPRRRRPRDVEEAPQNQHGELAVYEGGPSANKDDISAGHRFISPSTEFPHWDEIMETIFKKFVEESQLPGKSPEKVKERNAYFKLVSDQVSKNPAWAIQPVQVERLVELLRIYQFGYGPLEDYMQIDNLEELYFNRFDEGFYIVSGEKHKIEDKVFRNESALTTFVQHVARENGLEINTQKPNLDATLKDGSRLNATLPPLAVDGPDFVIRKFREIGFTLQQYIDTGMLTEEMAKDIEKWVKSGLNIVVSGGTGSGKTTFLNTIGNTFIPASDRVLVLENRKELQIETRDTKYFQTREDATRENNEGDIRMGDLIRYCLRKRPDRIIVGEVRGSEAYAALVAWNSGHDGSFCTIHADNAPSAVDKLEQLSMEQGKMSEEAVRKLIARSVDVIIQVQRIKGKGERRVTEAVQVFHPRKYDRLNPAVRERVKKLTDDKENGLYSFGGDLWLLPLYQLGSDNKLIKVNELIPIQGKS